MRERSRTEFSMLNIITGLGGYLLNTILGFVCRIVFVYCLSADYLGVNGLFTNILSMLSLAELGIGSAVVYALYKPLAEHDEEKIASLVNFYGKSYRAIGCIIAIIGLLLIPFLGVIISEQPNIKESIYVLYLINLFNTASTYFFSYRSSLIIASQKNYIVGAVSYIIAIVQSIIQMIVLLVFHNYLIYLLIQTIGTFLYNVTVSKIAVKLFPYIKSKSIKALQDEEKKSLFRNVRDLMIYKISSLLVHSTDNILITFFDGLIVTGVASNYTLLVNTLNSLLGQVFNGLTASIGNHNATEELEKKYDMFNFLYLMNFWIFGWATLGIVFCSGSIVQLCFGKEYVLPLEIPIIMAVNFYLVGMLNAIWTYKHTMGLFHYGRFMQIGTGVLNILFSIILGMKWGLFGILAATVVARVLTSTWYDPYAVLVHGFKKSPMLYWKKYIKYLGVLLIAAVGCGLVSSYIKGAIVWVVIGRVVACSAITNIVFYLSFYKTKEFSRLRDICKTLIKIINK